MSSSSMEKGSSASDSDFDSDATDGDASPLFSAVSAPTGPRASAAKTSDGTNGGAWFSDVSAPTGPRASAAKTSAANPGKRSAMNLRSAPSSHPQADHPATRAAVNVRSAPSSHPQVSPIAQTGARHRASTCRQRQRAFFPGVGSSSTGPPAAVAISLSQGGSSSSTVAQHDPFAHLSRKSIQKKTRGEGSMMQSNYLIMKSKIDKKMARKKNKNKKGKKGKNKKPTLTTLEERPITLSSPNHRTTAGEFRLPRSQRRGALFRLLSLPFSLHLLGFSVLFLFIFPLLAMFVLRVHSVDLERPISIEDEDSGFSYASSRRAHPPGKTIPSLKLTERKGLIHLYRNSSHSSFPNLSSRSTTLFVVAVPNYLSSLDFIRFCDSQIAHVSQILFTRNDGMEDRYSVLITLSDQSAADGFHKNLNMRHLTI